MRSVRAARQNRTGGAAVELVVLFPVILLILIGMVDYGRVFYTSVQVSNAARAGAEYGQYFQANSHADTAGMRTVTQADGNDAGTLTVNSRFYCECGVNTPNNSCGYCGTTEPEVYVEVIARKTVRMYFAYPGLPDSIRVERKAIFRSQ